MTYLIAGFNVFLIGLITFSGGPVFFSLFSDLMINNLKIIDEVDFGKIMALCNMTPGSVGIKLSSYLGYLIDKNIWFSILLAFLISAPAGILAVIGIKFLAQIKKSKNLSDFSIYVTSITIGVYSSLVISIGKISYLNMNKIHFFIILFSSLILLLSKKLDIIFIIILVCIYSLCFL